MIYTKYIITGSVLAFSIVQLNSILTTVILVLTIAWWIQKNIRDYRRKD